MKISLSQINGETTQIAKNVVNPQITFLELVNKFNSKLSILWWQTIRPFTGYLYLNNENSNNENSFKTIKITGNNFIPSGSIVKSKHT